MPISRLIVALLFISTPALADKPFTEDDLNLRNTVPPLLDPDDARSSFKRAPGSLPLIVRPHVEHIRGEVPAELSSGRIESVTWTAGDLRVQTGSGEVSLSNVDNVDVSENAMSIPPWLAPRLRHNPYHQRVVALFAKTPPGRCNDILEHDGTLWVATDDGLYARAENGSFKRLTAYGMGGPLAAKTTALAVVGGRLWVGTPRGISVRHAAGAWSHIRGPQGLPYEDVTTLHAQDEDVWIGTTYGAILYRPHATGRQWYYRAGERYLPNDRVNDIASTPDGTTVYFATDDGLGRIDLVTTSLEEKARIIEKRVNERHRRLGLVAACTLDDAHNPTSHTIGDNDNDGLWTAYHVGAMAMAYAVTGEPAAKASARESMHALYMLQDASDVPGIVARSVLPADIGRTKGKQWRPTSDGLMYWKSDTSSDEIDGHYFAFYTYWEHIARHDPEERELLAAHIRTLTDYLVDNDYLLIDWDGKHTRWGFWKPEMLNDQPSHYLENGLNSLQMLSFLKVAHHITGDNKYDRHYRKLITKHGYLDNVLLEKKVFPDENNHSDNQLAAVAYYPILQLEHDPLARKALQKAARRHYKTLADDKSSFFYFVFATVDPDYVELDEAIENLQEIPIDRRNWAMRNSHRADITFDPRADRFGDGQLLRVLPADERHFERWNKNFYVPDGGGDGRNENDGAAYLLPYWMGRYHGFLREAE